MIYQAHKGVSSENPENTMPAFLAAIEQGYGIIELDVTYTRDGKFVLLHDKTVNRTGRFPDGRAIPETLEIKELSYGEALSFDFGIGYARKFAGTKIPLFEEVLALAAKHGVKLKIDNKYQRYPKELKEAFFRLLLPYERVACLTCSSLEELDLAMASLPEMDYHYDGKVDEETLAALSRRLPRERLTVWLPHQNPRTSWVKVAFASKELAEMIRPYARLGVWILARPEELAEAEALGAEVVETNGQLKPPQNEGMIADLHTHSRHSHDSVCPIEESCRAQIEKGTDFFAVTDHFDTASFTRYNVFTPIQTAAETVDRLNGIYGDRITILKGIEISEGFWYPAVYEKARRLADYDLIIGSVHLVKYKDLTYAYSKMDFSRLPKETVAEYVDAYFDDVLTMLEQVDFDILAHLTCPLRYITSNYGITLERARYEEKIERILKQIIKKGIALEVNTSAYGPIGSFMPDGRILRRYRELGGYLITLGSDAHKSANVSQKFEETLSVLTELGFKEIYYYKNRRPYPITVERRKA